MRHTMMFNNINILAKHLRNESSNKKIILLYAFNGTGKTRLSSAFKELGKVVTSSDKTETCDPPRDTLYFNSFTQDLFSWDNDLDNDTDRKLKINTKSRFFAGLDSMEMDNRIRTLLNRYADFEFLIDTSTWEVIFSRESRVKKDDFNREKVAIYEREVDVYETRRVDAIKISRGEENIFIWCFFLAVLQLALDDDGSGPYKWVKYIYIDDPISSLDDHNAIAVACHLAQILKTKSSQRTVISTHHALFFNALCNEIPKAKKYFLSRQRSTEELRLCKTGDTPFFYHVSVLVQLHKAVQEGRLYTYHFNMLRSVLEKTASFHGYKKFSECFKSNVEDEDIIFHTRLINILNHGNYSLFEPVEMQEENKQHFRKILHTLITQHSFNPKLFSNETKSQIE